MKRGRPPRDLQMRFDGNWALNPETGCHLWTARCYNNGYGQFRGVKTGTAHRIAWELINGPVPAGLCVLHHCDVRPCVNPAHLFLGTHQDNTADRHAKARDARGDNNGSRRHPEARPRGNRNTSRSHPELLRRGESHGMSKLDNVKVLTIRSEYETGFFSQIALGERYGVSQALIGMITRRKIWRHV